MFPKINIKETGINLRRIMNKNEITAKDIQRYLHLSSVQSVYHWLNGTNMPTIDNLYALSELFHVPIDEIVCGNRKPLVSQYVVVLSDRRDKRLFAYYKKLTEQYVA